MKRAKTQRKSTKKLAKTHVEFVVSIDAAHAFIRISVDCDKILSKKVPKLMRELADAIDSGELRNEITKFAGVYGVSIPK